MTALGAAPLLAALVTVDAGDRTELRLRTLGAARVLEVETAPGVSLGIASRRDRLELGYFPRLTLTPVDAPDRRLLIVHGEAATLTRELRRATLTATQTASYGERDLRLDPLAARAPSAGAPAAGGLVETPRAAGARLRFGSASGDLGATHRLSRSETFAESAGWQAAGGVGSRSERIYPLAHGPRARAAYTIATSPRDLWVTSLRGTQSYASTGAELGVVEVDQGYVRRITDGLSLGVTAGVAGTRAEEPEGRVRYGVVPIVGLGSNAGLRYEARVGGGLLVAYAGAAHSPVVDPQRLRFDPRVSVLAGSSYLRGGFGVALTASGQSSVRPERDGALQAAALALGVSQQLATGLSVDAGVRAAWQEVVGDADLPPSASAYAGVTFGERLWSSSAVQPGLAEGRGLRRRSPTSR